MKTYELDHLVFVLSDDNRPLWVIDKDDNTLYNVQKQ